MHGGLLLLQQQLMMMMMQSDNVERTVLLGHVLSVIVSVWSDL